MAERLGSLVFHAHTVNSVSDAIVLPDSLEMAEDLAKLLRAYVADPYNELCDCNAPLRRETCFVCSQQLCMSDEFGLAFLSVGRDCGRTGYLCRVKGMTVEKPVCIRHTQEEIEACGLVYNAVTDDEA